MVKPVVLQRNNFSGRLNLNSVFNVVWLTGMSGSGKSTLASFIKTAFQKEGFKVQIIDGDDVRDQDSNKLGFGLEDVEINNLRIAKLCLELKNRDYDLVLVPVISPYDRVRKKTREILEPYYHLVYVKAEVESLRKRDTKGLYKAADQGEITDLIGYSLTNPYEEPNDADLILNTDNRLLIGKTKQLFQGFVDSIII